MAMTTGDTIWAQWNRNRDWTITATGNLNTVTVTGEQFDQFMNNNTNFMVGTGNLNQTFTYNQMVDTVEVNADLARQMQINEQARRACYTTRCHGDGVNGYTWEGYQVVVRREIRDLTDIEWRTIEDGYRRGLEERLEDQRRYAIRAQERDIRALRETQAMERAERLLLSLLNAEEQQEWRQHRRLTVRTTEREWRLLPRWAGGAILMAGGVERAVLCVHPRDRVPDVDTVVALLMALRAGDENHVLQVAILHYGEFTEAEHDIRRGRPEAPRPRLRFAPDDLVLCA